MSKFITSLSVIILIGLQGDIHAQENQRFSAPDINAGHQKFLQRSNTDLINIDFVVANAIGEIKRANEDGESINGIIDENTPDSSNSVIVQPGADTDNLTIININEGDSTVISR